MTKHVADSNCLFCKIAAGKIPANILYEDEDFLAFHDIHPAAPVHFLLIPKMHIASLAHVDATHADLMGRMMTLVPQLALKAGCAAYPAGGYRLQVNTGEHGGQEIHHLHFHVLGGPRPWAKN